MDALIFLSFPHIGKKRHESRAFDGDRDLALMLGADVGVARVNDLRLARNEPLQKIGLFIIHVLQILGAEETLLGHTGCW
jgi:hypothetical protein